MIAAPAIVRASNIMPVKSIILPDSAFSITGHVRTYDIGNLDINDFSPYYIKNNFDYSRHTDTDYREAVKSSGIDSVDERWKRLVARQERGVIYV